MIKEDNRTKKCVFTFYKCAFCNDQIHSRQCFKEHTLRMHKDKLFEFINNKTRAASYYKCKFCNRKWHKSVDIKEHILKEHLTECYSPLSKTVTLPSKSSK